VLPTEGEPFPDHRRRKEWLRRRPTGRHAQRALQGPLDGPDVHVGEDRQLLLDLLGRLEGVLRDELLQDGQLVLRQRLGTARAEDGPRRRRRKRQAAHVRNVFANGGNVAAKALADGFGGDALLRPGFDLGKLGG